MSFTQRMLALCAAVAVFIAACATPALCAPHTALTSDDVGCLTCHGLTGYALRALRDAGEDVSASDAGCISCHVDGSAAPRVYGGDENAYRAADGSGHGGPGSPTCVECHSGHGPFLENPDGVTEMSLRALDYQAEAVSAADPRTAPHDIAVAVWCTGCHAIWSQPVAPLAVDGAVPESVWLSRGGHPFAPPAGTAFRGSFGCRACHSAEGQAPFDDFPHVTGGYDGLLEGAASASLPDLTGLEDRGSDTVCLRCHRDGEPGRETGIGVDY